MFLTRGGIPLEAVWTRFFQKIEGALGASAPPSKQCSAYKGVSFLEGSRARETGRNMFIVVRVEHGLIYSVLL